MDSLATICFVWSSVGLKLPLTALNLMPKRAAHSPFWASNRGFTSAHTSISRVCLETPNRDTYRRSEGVKHLMETKARPGWLEVASVVPVSPSSHPCQSHPPLLQLTLLVFHPAFSAFNSIPQALHFINHCLEWDHSLRPGCDELLSCHPLVAEPE